MTKKFLLLLVLVLVLVLDAFSAPQAVYVNPDGSIVNTTDFKFKAHKLQICDANGANCIPVDTTLDGKQPLDSDLTAIAGISTTDFGRNLLALPDGTAAIAAFGKTTLAGYGITDAQPLDSDLTAIAGLVTDSFGRAVLTKTDALSIRTYIGAGTSSFDGAFSSLTGKPTTVGGYGITDFNSLGDARWPQLAGSYANPSWITSLPWSKITTTPTTIGGYGITDFNSLGDARWQPLDADLTSWAAIARASGFDIFAATPTLANLSLLVSDDDVAGIAANNTFTGQNTFALGNLTASKPLTLTETWNNSGITFTGLFFNVTDTASTTTSLLFDFQKNSTSLLSLRKDSILQLGSGGEYRTSGGAGVAYTNSGPRIGGTTNTLQLGYAGNSSSYGAEIDLAGSTASSNPGTIIFRAGTASAQQAELMRLNGAGLLSFGGTTSSFPAIKRSGTTLAFRLADDSADAPITAAAGTFSSLLTPSAGIKGTTTNDNATAGNVGETVPSDIPSGSAISLTTDTSTNLTSIPLTAGDWVVSGNVNVTYTSATTLWIRGGINTTSATLPADGTFEQRTLIQTGFTGTDSLAFPSKRISLSGSTTVYLVVRTSFSAGTAAAYGRITAVRIR